MGAKTVGSRHWTRILVEPSRTLNIISVLLQIKSEDKLDDSKRFQKFIQRYTAGKWRLLRFVVGCILK